MNEELKNAVDTLANALREQPDYYDSWKSNIAMFVYDALPETPIDKHVMAEASNNGAKAFLDTFIHMK